VGLQQEYLVESRDFTRNSRDSLCLDSTGYGWSPGPVPVYTRNSQSHDHVLIVDASTNTLYMVDFVFVCHTFLYLFIGHICTYFSAILDIFGGGIAMSEILFCKYLMN